MRTCLLALVLAILVLSGCGDSPEHLIEQARLALNSGKPELALGYAKRALDAKPDDPFITLVLARAQHRLRHYDEAEASLRKLIALKTDDADAYRELLNLALSRMTELLASTEFTKSTALQEAFGKAKELGHEQADWLHTKGQSQVDADFARARLLILDTQRINLIVREEESVLRGEAALDPNADVTSASIEEQKRQVKGMLKMAEQHLTRVLELNPSHYQAAGLLAQQYRSRESWSELWIIASQLAERKDLTPTLSAELVSDVLSIPEKLQTKATRLATARKLLEAVAPDSRKSVQWKMMNAKLLLQEGNKPLALEMAAEAYRLQPQDADVRLTYAWALYETEQYPLAKTLLETLATQRSQSEYVQMLYGLTLIKTGDKVPAAEALRRATAINKDNRTARAALIQLLSEGRDSAAAVAEDIDVFYKSNPTDPEAIRFKYLADVARGHDPSVKAVMEATEKIAPLKAGHLRTLVDGYAYLKNYEKSLRYASDCVRIEPEHVGNHLMLVRVRLLRNETDVARKLLVELKSKFPESPDVNETLAQLYVEQGAYDRAVELIAPILKATPDHIPARLLMAQAYSRLAMTDEALDQVKIVLDKSPNDPRGLEMAASIYRMLGQPDIARAYLEKIDEASIDERTMPGVLAQLKLQKGNIAEALAICQRALASGSTDPIVRLTIVGIHAANKNVGEEEVQLIALIREYPNDFLSYKMLVSFYAKNNPTLGLKQFRQLRSFNEPYARFAEAQLLQATGNTGEAISELSEVYEKLIAKRDQLALPYARALAGLFLNQSSPKTAEAIAVFQKMVDAKLWVAEARVAQIGVDWDRSTPATNLARLDAVAKQLEPRDEITVNRIIALYGVLKRYDRAVEVFTEWMANHPTDVRLIRVKGDLLKAAKRYPEAIATYEEALKIEPSETTFERLGQVHVAAGNFPEAAKTFDKMATLNAGARIRAVAAKGAMFFVAGLHQQVLDTLNELGDAGSTSDPRVAWTLGQALAAMGKNAEARARLSLVPRHAPQYAQAQLMLAKLEQQLGNMPDAQNRLLRLTSERATAEAAARELVLMGIRNRDDENILKWSERAIAIPNAAPSYKLEWLGIRAGIFAESGKWDLVEKTTKDALLLDPQSIRLKANLIVLTAYQNRTEDAKAAYNQAGAEFAKTDLGALLAVALGLPVHAEAKTSPVTAFLAALEAGDRDAARAAVEKTGTINNTVYRSDLLALVQKHEGDLSGLRHAARRTAMANVALEAGVPHLCEKISLEVVEAAPKFVPAHGLLFAALSRLNKPFDAAIARVERAIPETTLALFVAATKQSKAGDFAAAIKSTRQIIEREPNHDFALYRLSGLTIAAKDFDAAIEVLEQLSKREGPYKVSASNDLAYYLLTKRPNQLERAYELAKGVRTVAPNLPQIYIILGRLEHLRGNHAEAMANLLRALAMGQDDSATLHLWLSEVYKQQGNAQWSRFHLQAAAAGPKDDEHAAQAAAALKG